MARISATILYEVIFSNGDSHEGFGPLKLFPDNLEFVSPGDSGNYGDIANPISHLREATGGVLNDFLDAIGGHSVGGDAINVKVYGRGDEDGVYTEVSYRRVNAAEPSLVEIGTRGGYEVTGQELLKYAVIQGLKHVEIAGGNLYMKRAIANSTAETLEQLAGELKVAEDYGRYLSYKPIIDALIAQSPNSAFAAAWIVTLLQAEALGITEQNKSDFYGGLAGFLESFDLQRFGSTWDDVSFEVDGDNLVQQLNIDDYEAMTRLTLLSADPTGATVTGAGSGDLRFAADGIASTFVDGASAPTIPDYAIGIAAVNFDPSLEYDAYNNDTLVGNTANDTISAGAGADPPTQWSRLSMRAMTRSTRWHTRRWPPTSRPSSCKAALICRATAMRA